MVEFCKMPMGTGEVREEAVEENRDKVIVFLGDAYGVFLLAELAVLSGLRLRRLPSSLCFRQDILQRYGKPKTLATILKQAGLTVDNLWKLL